MTFVSGAAQVHGGGFPRQRDAVARRAAAMGAEVIAEFADEGGSGTLPLAERPGLSALLDRVLGNGMRLVLVEKADRLARELGPRRPRSALTEVPTRRMFGRCDPSRGCEHDARPIPAKDVE